MVKKSSEVGPEVKLSLSEEEIARGVERQIDDILALERRGKGEYTFNITVKNHLSDNVIRAIVNRYIDAKWKEMLISAEGHIVPDDSYPHVYSVHLKV